ncbi:hypothetical protein HPC49_16090 [Pyxidicoccus fallax]|uniref:CARDB domain-containing protein n=1 Tax=Pyxidicoccus fallax TaxID=394095 RepID=A0A848LJN3_9BACT|nr:hypothetical protein [Pyxidicoccus fallax]NMO17904.1 hypothetical protein [Pyxidicoccus fallax]NPC79740.1 hypothetical protein [Pyxidicoccus fallax]
MTKSRGLAAALLVASLFAASPVWAQVQVFTFSAPTTIPNPYSTFTVQYTLGGSKLYQATAQLRFYLSTTRNGTTSRVLMDSRQILLRAGANGLYLPPIGTQTASFMLATVQPDAQTVLAGIAQRCAPETWYLQAEVDFTTVQGDDTVIGTTKPADFYFTGGTLSPTTIQPGGTTNFSFTLATQCPATAPSTVGVFLADANYQLLSYIGGVSIGTGSGTFSLPPTPITFSPTIAPGAYNIVLLADVDGVIAESNENNNAGAFALDIVPSALAAARGEAGPLTLDVPVPAEAASLPDGSQASMPDNDSQKL